MGKEPIADHTGSHVPPDDLVKDEKAANPAHPLPAPNAAPETVAQQVERDAEIEDRFEATDN
jgi:hypothetical protein